MADYDEDKATLQRIKAALRRKYFDPAIPPEPDCTLPDGRLFGPKTREEYEQMLKEMDEAAVNVENETRDGENE